MTNAITIGLSGLNAATNRINEAATNIAKLGNTDALREDTIDLSTEAVNLILAKTEYKASLAIIEAAKELDDELLSIFDEKV